MTHVLDRIYYLSFSRFMIFLSDSILTDIGLSMVNYFIQRQNILLALILISLYIIIYMTNTSVMTFIYVNETFICLSVYKIILFLIRYISVFSWRLRAYILEMLSLNCLWQWIFHPSFYHHAMQGDEIVPIFSYSCLLPLLPQKGESDVKWCLVYEMELLQTSTELASEWWSRLQY